MKEHFLTIEDCEKARMHFPYFLTRCAHVIQSNSSPELGNDDSSIELSPRFSYSLKQSIKLTFKICVLPFSSLSLVSMSFWISSAVKIPVTLSYGRATESGILEGCTSSIQMYGS